MTYQINFVKKAHKELSDIPEKQAKKIYRAIYSLTENPRKGDCKKLKDSVNEYRPRVGDYRVLYVIEDKIKIVEVYRIGHRRNVYD